MVCFIFLSLGSFNSNPYVADVLPTSLKSIQPGTTLSGTPHCFNPVYVMLVVVASQHYEHGLNFSFSPTGQTTMSVTVSVITQTFSTVSWDRVHVIDVNFG